MRKVLFILLASLSLYGCKGDKSYQKLVWSDEFDGTSVSLENWTFETGASGWGNDELQNYTDGDNAEVKGGILTITARKVVEGDSQKPGDYTSTRIISKGKQEFLYGRIEARMKMPKGVGGWAAFWMLGANFPKEKHWPHCGEIDIMEYVGYTPDTHNMALHNGFSSGDTVNKSSIEVADLETEFHTYGILWSEKQIEFYIDGMDNVVYTYAPEELNSDTWPYDKSHFLILNLAVGGGWGGRMGVDDSAFPMTFEIDYVRVFE